MQKLDSSLLKNCSNIKIKKLNLKIYNQIFKWKAFEKKEEETIKSSYAWIN